VPSSLAAPFLSDGTRGGLLLALPAAASKSGKGWRVQPPELIERAIKRAAQEVRRARYLSYSVSDEQLAERAVRAYQEAVRATRSARSKAKGASRG
jgi:hypothetical protein